MSNGGRFQKGNTVGKATWFKKGHDIGNRFQKGNTPKSNGGRFQKGNTVGKATWFKPRAITVTCVYCDIVAPREDMLPDGPRKWCCVNQDACEKRIELQTAA